MFRVDAGRTPGYCDGLTRRSFVQLGLAGMGSLAAADVLRARAASASTAAGGAAAKDTSLILIWLDGGPSHLDLYDLKPEAPAEVRGIWSPIRTNVPGIDISELFPLQARTADKFSHHPLAASRHGRPFRRRPLDAHGQRAGATAGARPAGTLHRRHRHQGDRSAAARECRLTWPCPMPSSIGPAAGIFRRKLSGQPTQSVRDRTATPTRRTFGVQNLQLPSGLSDRPLGRPPRTCSSISIACGANATPAARSTRSTVFSAKPTTWCQQQSGEGVRPEREDAASCATATAATPGGRARCWPGGWSRPARTFVTVHCGGWDHHWSLKSGMESYLPQIDRWFRPCSRI